MESNPTFLTVVAAAIRDGRDRLLLQKAAPHKRHGGLWEFPGGKVESDEIPRLALVREIAEELNLTLDETAMVPAGFAEEPAASGFPGIVLLLYICPIWSGEPIALEQQEWGWFTLAEAAQLELPRMDRMLLSRLSRELPGAD